MQFHTIATLSKRQSLSCSVHEFSMHISHICCPIWTQFGTKLYSALVTNIHRACRRRKYLLFTNVNKITFTHAPCRCDTQGVKSVCYVTVHRSQSRDNRDEVRLLRGTTCIYKSLSVSFHLCSTLIFITCCSYQRGKRAKPGNLPKSKVLKIGEHWIEKYYGPVFVVLTRPVHWH